MKGSAAGAGEGLQRPWGHSPGQTLPPNDFKYPTQREGGPFRAPGRS